MQMYRYQQPALVNVDKHHTVLLQEQLVREITGLERRLEQMQREQFNVDFSMTQTFKEMIHSRRALLGHLPHQQQ